VDKCKDLTELVLSKLTWRKPGKGYILVHKNRLPKNTAIMWDALLTKVLWPPTQPGEGESTLVYPCALNAFLHFGCITIN
jgi:hypothetical protein